MFEKKEKEFVAKAMNNAGYKGVTADMIVKVKNKYCEIVYVAVVGDAMIVYTPKYNYHNDGGFNFVRF